jgi:putative NADH-flavin reductase
MELTVFGATGGIGGHLVRQALEQGHAVTAVVRDPARLDVADHAALRVAVVPDVTDAEALKDVVAGCDAVLSALGPPGRKPVGIASAATRAILRAMDVGGVRRVLVVSAAPVGPTAEHESLLMRTVATPVIRAVLRDGYADLALMEQLLQAGDTDWTVVRPPRLTDRPLTGRYRTSLGGPPAHGWSVSRADVAHAMLAALGDRATYRQALGVAD